MNFTEPRHYILATTQVDTTGMDSYLAHVGAPGWATDAVDDAEFLVEVVGRTCYRSFAPGLNANVRRVREGNQKYLGNVLSQHHGSLFEHATVTVAFCDVSRVFTHELVRHRAGMAYSQESLRYVRLTELRAYMPEAFKYGELYQLALSLDMTVEEADAWAREREGELGVKFVEVFRGLERAQADVARMLHLDAVLDFDKAKRVTSAMRRMAPLGLATTIVATGNHRAWRHLLQLRTDSSAEEEMRRVFYTLGLDLKARFPAIYQDMVDVQDAHGLSQWVFQHSKV